MDNQSYSVLRRADNKSVEDQHRWSLGMLSSESLADQYTLAYTHVQKTYEQVLIHRGLTPIAWLKDCYGGKVGMRMNKTTINNEESSILAMCAISRKRPAIKL